MQKTFEIYHLDTDVVQNCVLAFSEHDFAIPDDCGVREVFEKFLPECVSREAEHRIQVGTQINGSVFKTDSESINRLRQILDVYSEPAETLSSIKIVTAAGELLEFDTREMVEEYYLAAIKYRAGILTRSAELQQLDLIPDPSQDILWDLTKSLKEVLAELT